MNRDIIKKRLAELEIELKIENKKEKRAQLENMIAYLKERLS